MHNILDVPNIPLLKPKRKYFIISDIHFEFREGQEEEFWKDIPEEEGVTICLCAGDITNVGRPYDLLHFTELCSRFEKVLYVPGNHEYYGSDPTSVLYRLAYIEERLPKLKILKTGEVYTYKGQRFIGDTMWFPDRPEVHIYKRMINDSFQIKGLLPWAFTHSSLFMLFLKDNVRTDDIVITHHIPNDNDTSAMFKGMQTEAYFLNKNCDRYCNDPNSILPKAWIYGHTHDKHDYYIRDTRFICNPVGYPGERTLGQCVYEI